MGVTTTNIVNQELDSIAGEYTDIYQGAGLSCTTLNEIALNDCKNLKNVDFEQEGMCKLNTNFGASTMVNNILKSKKDADIKQVAKSVAQSVSMNPGSINATNVSKQSSVAIGNMITNIENGCYGYGTSKNMIICDGENGLKGTYFKQSDSVNAFQSCINTNSIKNTLSQSLTDITDQYAKGVEQNALFWIAIATMTLVAAFIIAKIIGGKKVKKLLVHMLILLIVIMIVVIVVGVIWAKTSKESSQSKNYRPPQDRCADCIQYTQKDLCEGALCTWIGDQPKSDTTTGDLRKNPNRCECDPVKSDCSNQCYLLGDDEEKCKSNYCAWNEEVSPKCTGLRGGGKNCNIWS